MFPEAIVKVNNLVKKYGDFTAVNGISFEVFRGELFSLLGPNGAGKSTTISIITGQMLPTSGSVEIFGLKPQDEAVRAKIGIMPQENIIYEDLSVKENIEFYGGLYDIPRGTLKERMDHLLSLFGITDKKKAKAASLSGGQKRILNLIVSIIHEPELLILDEPTTGLDVNRRQIIYEFIREYKKSGRTIILTTHYIEEAEKLADRVAIMSRGKIIALGSPDELKRRYEINETRVVVEGTFPKTAQNLGKLSEGKLTTYVTDHEKEVPRLLEALFKMGGVIEKVHIYPPSLEDVFIKLTGKSIEEDEVFVNAR